MICFPSIAPVQQEIVIMSVCIMNYNNYRFSFIPIQWGKLHLCQNSCDILSHSIAVSGGLTYCSFSADHSALHISCKIEQTVDFPMRKLNDNDTCID